LAQKLFCQEEDSLSLSLFSLFYVFGLDLDFVLDTSLHFWLLM